MFSIADYFIQDPDLKRCFGVDRKIEDCTWSFLKTLRTSRTPHEPLACLRDLLELLRKPEWQSIWLLLDVKVLQSVISSPYTHISW